jgi:uncharacterized protein
MKSSFDFDEIRNLTVGTVESVSPSEIKVLLETEAPQNIAINTGVPTHFPKINGYLLIPNELGAIVGIISWIGVEHSNYPKRKGFKDFDLIDLPFPLRKLYLNPIGILKKKQDFEKVYYEIERGVYSYPSVGDSVILPTNKQLESIVENTDKYAKVIIGKAPIAGNAEIKVNPDKLFGRHLAVLGNTGSGKSCSVAGIIRWALEAAEKEKKNDTINARFIILDPNGEYSKTFDDLGEKVRKFRVQINEDKAYHQLKVPAWMWNSYEWSSITQASGKTQRPVLRQALRELRAGQKGSETNEKSISLRRYLTGNLIIIQKALAWLEYKTDASKFGFFLVSILNDCNTKKDVFPEYAGDLQSLHDRIKMQCKKHFKSFNDKQGKLVEYFVAFEENEIQEIIDELISFIEKLGGLVSVDGPNEDSPVEFDVEELPNFIEKIAQEQKSEQFLDFLIMRIRTMLTDSRLCDIISGKESINLDDWLSKYVGSDNGENGNIAIIDLSLVPSDVIHLVIAVVGRIIFEALQRYRRQNGNELPTNLILEEAHTFIKRYKDDSDEISSQKMCCQTFEKIAREGRKFGLGLVLSSQRPSELSPTALSQCNTFLIHRIVNDEDQRLVRRLVPDNMGSLLDELPVLPSRKAVLVGWAFPIPVLVEINYLAKEFQPHSSDPKFWDVWIGNEQRTIEWGKIVREWQNKL